MSYATFDTNLFPDLHPIFIACKNGDVGAVGKYLEDGVDPYIDHATHPTLNIIALGNGDRAMIDVLVKHGMDVNRPVNRFGETLLLRALAEQGPEVVLHLLALGADPNQPDQGGFSPLMSASVVSNLPMIEVLLAHGADPKQISNRGRTAFMEAVGSNQIAAMEFWHGRGEDLEGRAEQALTPLIISAKGGKMEALLWLLDHGADIRAEAEYGKTALDWAVANKHLEIAEVLRGRMGLEG